MITEDNLVVLIDTVLFFQVTDPRAADYEIVNYIQAIEQLTATMLRSVIGSMDLEDTLTSRDKINNMLRGVLDDASGKWGIRVTRVEIKAIDPPKSVVDAMEKQMRAEREKRAAILTAEGVKQAKILTAEGEKQSNILTAEGEKQSAILRSEGQAQAIGTVFQAVHRNDPDPKLLAWQYLQTLPQLAQGPGNTCGSSRARSHRPSRPSRPPSMSRGGGDGPRPAPRAPGTKRACPSAVAGSPVGLAGCRPARGHRSCRERRGGWTVPTRSARSQQTGTATAPARRTVPDRDGGGGRLGSCCSPRIRLLRSRSFRSRGPWRTPRRGRSRRSSPDSSATGRPVSSAGHVG